MDILDPKTFYFELPLYTKIEIGEQNKALFLKLLNFEGRLDGYSPHLKENTTYSIRPLLLMKGRGVTKTSAKTYADVYYGSGSIEHSEIVCVRTNEVFHVLYYFDRHTKHFMKIGQFPSIADLHISQIKNYDKVLDREQLREFTRAIGLAANGVGIGSFVYLRRIFEDLIYESKEEATKVGINVSTFKSIRMDEKIQLLHEYLPEFLVKNKSLYSILSKGIHELTENECLENFEVVKVGIELILDEKLEKYNKIKRIEEATKRISIASSTIKSEN